MTVAIELSARFVAWAHRAQNTVTWAAPALVVADAGGEIRYSIRETAGQGFVLGWAERATGERFIMASQHLHDLERFLARELAHNVRQVEGLARLQFPGRIGEFASGLSGWEDAGFGYVRVAAGDPVRFAARDPYLRQPAEEFSHIARSSLAEIIASAGSVTGAPLFSVTADGEQQ